jgi:hypothetical protein
VFHKIYLRRIGFWYDLWHVRTFQTKHGDRTVHEQCMLWIAWYLLKLSTLLSKVSVLAARVEDMSGSFYFQAEAEYYDRHPEAFA